MVSHALLRKLDLGHRTCKEVPRGSVHTCRRRCGGKKAFLRKFTLYLNLNHPRGGVCEVVVVTIQVVQALTICVCILIAEHPRAESSCSCITGTRMNARVLMEVIGARETFVANVTLVRAFHSVCA